MTILKTTTKQSHWDLSTKMKFDQKIYLHENRNRGELNTSFLDVLFRNLLFKVSLKPKSKYFLRYKQNPNK